MVATLGIFLAVLPAIASCRAQPQTTDLSWAPARETPVLDEAAQVALATPPQPTAAPAHPRDFLKRSSNHYATCGYDPFDGDPLSCYGTCNSNSTNDMWGCCYIYAGQTTCYQTEPTTCIEYDWDSTTISTSTCNYYDDIDCTSTRNYATLYCSHNSMWTSSGYCMTYLSTSSSKTYSSFLCGNVHTAIKISSSEFYTTKSYDPYLTSTTGTETETETETAAGPIVTLTDEDIGRQRSSTIGAMVGGAVGGIALVGAVTVAVVFLVLRRKRDNASLSSEKQAAFAEHEGGATPTRGSNESPAAAPSQPGNPAPAVEGAAATSGPIPATTGRQDDNGSARA